MKETQLRLDGKAPSRPRKRRPAPFLVPVALQRAARILAGPCHGHVPRVEPTGELVARFALPLDLCQPQNRTKHAPAWSEGKRKREIWTRLRGQCLPREEPLPGRPLVVCTRFSSVEPDAFSDGAKAAVDALCVPVGRRKRGLSLIRDDKPKDVEIVQRWEKAKQGQGFVLVEVYDDPSASQERAPRARSSRSRGEPQTIEKRGTP